MKKFLKYSFCALICLALSGCLNIMNHTGTCVETYEATETVWSQGICVWWNDDFKGRHPFGAMIVMYTYPFWFVDLPCEAVADTVTFPWDLRNKIRYNKRYRANLLGVKPETLKDSE